MVKDQFKVIFFEKGKKEKFKDREHRFLEMRKWLKHEGRYMQEHKLMARKSVSKHKFNNCAMLRNLSYFLEMQHEQYVSEKHSDIASFEILLQRKSRKRGGAWRSEVEGGVAAAAPAAIGKKPK